MQTPKQQILFGSLFFGALFLIATIVLFTQKGLFNPVTSGPVYSTTGIFFPSTLIVNTDCGLVQGYQTPEYPDVYSWKGKNKVTPNFNAKNDGKSRK